VIRIPLHGRLGAGKAALVDDCGADVVLRTWWLGPNGYVCADEWDRDAKRSKRVLLHRLIMGFPTAKVDHVNRDRLDCRRSNLRSVSNRENAGNQPGRGGLSRFRGVTRARDRQAKPWRAQVKIDGRNHYVGSFITEAEAGEAARDYRLAHMPGAVD
jgi:hypothetical protein